MSRTCMSNAWKEGFKAYQCGVPFGANPYPICYDDDRWIEWENGWVQACKWSQ